MTTLGGDLGRLEPGDPRKSCHTTELIWRIYWGRVERDAECTSGDVVLRREEEEEKKGRRDWKRREREGADSASCKERWVPVCL